jgi:hypothetical protein
VTEQELINNLEEADREVVDAKKVLAEAKKRWTDAETDLIGAKINRDRAKETLRVYRNVTPKCDPDQRDLELERFRAEHPELVEFARQRDEDKAKGNDKE